MAFEDIDCVKPKATSAAAVPLDGLRVAARAVGLRAKAGIKTRYIRIDLGAALARKASLTQDKHQLRLLFGTDEDAGKVRVSVDNAGGKFVAKRTKFGGYFLVINAATAEGLFALEFPSFIEARIEVLRPQTGQPPHFVFHPSKAMLAVAD